MGLSKKIRLFESLVAASALLVLTGAKGEGCIPGEAAGESEETTETIQICEPGFHLEPVCTFEGCAESDDPTACREPQCEDTCVPDQACPEGTVEQLVCSEPQPVDDSGVDCEGDYCEPPPPPEDCWLECLPIEPCPPDMIAQEICLPDDGDPTTAEPCRIECLPALVCAPGEHAETVCTDGPEGETLCETLCVADELPIPPQD